MNEGCTSERDESIGDLAVDGDPEDATGHEHADLGELEQTVLGELGNGLSDGFIVLGKVGYLLFHLAYAWDSGAEYPRTESPQATSSLQG